MTRRKKKVGEIVGNLYYDEKGIIPIWSPTNMNHVLARVERQIAKYSSQHRPRKVQRWLRRKQIVLERLEFIRKVNE